MYFLKTSQKTLTAQAAPGTQELSKRLVAAFLGQNCINFMLRYSANVRILAEVNGAATQDPDVKELAQVLLTCLSRPPSKAGARLIPERELAKTLGVTRYQVSRAIDDLVDQEILARRPGSGTYIRKVAGVRSDEKLASKWEGRGLAPENLLAIEPQKQLRLRPRPEQKALQIALWSDLHCSGVSANGILQGIENRTRELGHKLTSHSVVVEREQPLPVEELAKRLAEQRADGYLIVMRWADLFLEACHQVWGKDLPPIAFVYSSNTEIDREPIIQLDIHEAVSRAVRLLASEGYRKIGYLGFHHPEKHLKKEHVLYLRAMEDAELEYRAAEFADWTTYANAICPKAWVAFARKLLDRPAPPEAVYVADDYLVAPLAEVLREKGLTPGYDFGVITLSNSNGSPLPSEYDWSCLEFDPIVLGENVLESLVRMIQSAGHKVRSLSHQATWRPGTTHLRGV